MSIVLDLPPELENKLALAASQRGLSLPDYVLHLLTGHHVSRAAPMTGADLITYWQNEGLIGARSDITDSSEHARSIRQRAERLK